MARTVELSTQLDCAADEAWDQIHRSALLQHIAFPLIKFVPRGATAFPERWEEGEYRAWMLLLAVLPIGWQAIVISKPEAKGAVRFLRDNGYGPLIKRWDHWIEIAPENATTTRYVDRVTIEAGILTPVIAAFARVFYGHRQRRWRALAASDFHALEK
ncbi:hypothetical protein [Erythrobacter rubeus]|uniref:Ligand-binding SRPBCC domain-containing protein n=1 Tax=Erythrobacter rubeus TaxID=2760803 RepID=A0ABR8KYB2_9SPHN|nr:hypothetical protein [Erythrobacter rubeus]MBD2843151.1 hypothetical protein [Erythrobacter rubeus]